jgi:pilus assembly protein CpaE
MTATKSTAVRVVVVGDTGPIQEQVLTALNSQADFELIEVLQAKDRLIRDIRAGEPHIVLVCPTLEGEAASDIIDDISMNFPEVVLVSILPENDPLMAQQVMLAGARAFLYHPFTQINLLATLRRVNEISKRGRQSPAFKALGAETARPVRSILVYSPRGGAGTSTIAANLALALREETDQRVLLLEGKLFFGHLGVLLNLRPQNTIADLIPHAANIDETLVQEVVTRHVTGVDVLLAPESYQVAQGIRPDELYSVFLNVQKFYDFVIVDAGSYLNENTVTLMDAADCILLITTPELASLHDTSRFIQITRSLSYPPEKLLIVLNRSGITGGVKPRDIEQAMRHPVFAEIPNDEVNALRSLNRGVPLFVRYPGSQVSKSLKTLSRNLLGLRTGVSSVERGEVDSAHRDVLLASSRLG